MLIFVHIPKNAGTTIDAILRRNFGRQYSDFYTDRCGTFLTEVEFIELIKSRSPHCTALAGHDFRPLNPEMSRLLNLHYITFIRHPVERAISLYYYERAHPNNPNDIALSSFSEYVNKRPLYDNAISNWQTYQLVGAVSLERAKEVLEQFLVVGLVEEFDKSLILLRERLYHVLGLSHFRIVYQRMNVSHNRQITSASLPQNIRDRLLEMNQEDLKLFEYTRRRLHEEVQYLRHVAYKTLLLKTNNFMYRYWPSLYDFYARKWLT